MACSSSDLMVWVKGVTDTAACRVIVSGDAIVDDLKEAIKKKMVFTFAAPKIDIAITKDGTFEEEDRTVSSIIAAGAGGSKSNPIYYRIPVNAEGSNHICLH